MSREDDNKVVPSAGYTAEEWAYLLSQKLTHANPKSVEEAKKVYAEIISAAIRAERESCAACADEYAEGTLDLEKHSTARNIAAKIRFREEDMKAFRAAAAIAVENLT